MNEIWGIITSITGILAVILAGINVFSNNRKKQMKCLEGKWYEYHWTNPNSNPDETENFKWFRSTLTVKSEFLSSYKLHYINNNVYFIGEARYIDKKDKELNGDILLKVQHKKKPSTSTIYFRYNIPETSNDNSTIFAGIWLSYNFAKKITSGASILSRNELSGAELDAKFEENFEVNKASIFVKSAHSRRVDSRIERFIRSFKK